MLSEAPSFSSPVPTHQFPTWQARLLWPVPIWPPSGPFLLRQFSLHTPFFIISLLRFTSPPSFSLPSRLSLLPLRSPPASFFHAKDGAKLKWLALDLPGGPRESRRMSIVKNAFSREIGFRSAAPAAPLELAATTRGWTASPNRFDANPRHSLAWPSSPPLLSALAHSPKRPSVSIPSHGSAAISQDRPAARRSQFPALPSNLCHHEAETDRAKGSSPHHRPFRCRCLFSPPLLPSLCPGVVVTTILFLLARLPTLFVADPRDRPKRLQAASGVAAAS